MSGGGWRAKFSAAASKISSNFFVNTPHKFAYAETFCLIKKINNTIMNSIDKKPDYRRIYKFITDKFNKTTHFKHGPFDETYYTLRVYETAKEIIEKLNKSVKKEQVLVACILHDIGKTKLKSSKLFSKGDVLEDASKEWKKHAKLGIPIAKKFLKQIGHSNEFIKEICYLIENHNLRGDELQEKSLELKILQDADLIADIGFAGFIRPFLYCGKFSKQSVIGSIKFIKKEDRTSNGGELNLPISKLIAKREMKIQTDLVKEISKEIDSDLL
jgi:putative nucleotidyltransferase with HDIG domain